MTGKVKKFLLGAILSVLVFSNFPSTGYSASQETAFKTDIIAPQAEEVGWYYRDVPGGKQKRLWSYTYGRWLTDYDIVYHNTK